MLTPNIEQFVKLHPGFIFKPEGEVGFGRKCAGILDKDSECYVDYSEYDEDFDYNHKHEVAMQKAPEDAYHKHDCLAVLGEGEYAIAQLEEWVGYILEAGLEVYRKPLAKNSVNALLAPHLPGPMAIRDKRLAE